MQKQIFEWAKLSETKYPELKLLHASMNGVKMTNSLTGKRAKETGLLCGIPDIHLPIANKKYISLWIELKIKGNKPTKMQEQIISLLNAYGNYAIVCYSFDEAVSAIKLYLEK